MNMYKAIKIDSDEIWCYDLLNYDQLYDLL